MSRIRLSEGSIVDQEVDAIVNAANTSLVLGTGVAGAIRERGGPSIQECCNELGPIKVGSAAITGAGELCAQWILHAAVMEIGGRRARRVFAPACRAAWTWLVRSGAVSWPVRRWAPEWGGSECSAVPKFPWKRPVGISLRTRLWTKSASCSSGSLHFAFSRWFRTQPPWRRR